MRKIGKGELEHTRMASVDGDAVVSPGPCAFYTIKITFMEFYLKANIYIKVYISPYK